MLTIPRGVVDKIVSEAEQSHPDECCGLLAGKGELVSRALPIANAQVSATGYFMDPQGQFEAARVMRQEGEELLGIYHSHPMSRAYPSERDVKLAFHDVVYLIVSVFEGEAGGKAECEEMRAFRITEGTVAEVPVRIS